MDRARAPWALAEVCAAPSGWAGQGAGGAGGLSPIMAATAFAGEVARGVLPTAHVGRLRQGTWGVPAASHWPEASVRV